MIEGDFADTWVKNFHCGGWGADQQNSLKLQTSNCAKKSILQQTKISCLIGEFIWTSHPPPLPPSKNLKWNLQSKQAILEESIYRYIGEGIMAYYIILLCNDLVKKYISVNNCNMRV